MEALTETVLDCGVWLDRDGALEVCDCLADLTSLKTRSRHVKHSFSAIWIDVDGLLEVLYRLLMFAQVSVNETTLNPYPNIVWKRRHQYPQLLQRLAIVANLLQHYRSVKATLEEVSVLIHCLEVALYRLLYYWINFD